MKRRVNICACIKLVIYQAEDQSAWDQVFLILVSFQYTCLERLPRVRSLRHRSANLEEYTGMVR